MDLKQIPKNRPGEEANLGGEGSSAAFALRLEGGREAGLSPNVHTRDCCVLEGFVRPFPFNAGS